MIPDDLDPDIRRFQRMLAEGYAAHPPLGTVSRLQARQIVEAVRAPLAQGGPKMVHTETVCIDAAPHGPLRLRIHRPSSNPSLPALVYLHGGGWVYFSLDTHDRLMREIASRARRVVVGVEYALAPEARFPVALEQTVAAWQWLHSQAPLRGIDVARIALGGDSVGANLALATALVLRNSGVAPDAVLMSYGVFSDDEDGKSFADFDGPQYALGRDEMRSFWHAYLHRDADRHNPLAMPMKAELHNLPRCCLVVAECDVLRDGSLAMADRLRAAGVPTRLQRHPRATHSFLEAMSFSPKANFALDLCCAWLREESPL